MSYNIENNKYNLYNSNNFRYSSSPTKTIHSPLSWRGAGGEAKIFYIHFNLFLIELGEYFYAIFMVEGATSFATAVHSQDGIAHVYATERN